jgi:hypothetical protein
MGLLRVAVVVGVVNSVFLALATVSYVALLIFYKLLAT